MEVKDPNVAMANELACLLEQLKATDLWPSKPPSKQAMQSNVPFAVDSMAFESWLAYIFIPKMYALLDRGDELPHMQIYPAAEMYLLSSAKGCVEGAFKENVNGKVVQSIDDILSCIQRIDDIAAFANGAVG